MFSFESSYFLSLSLYVCVLRRFFSHPLSLSRYLCHIAFSHICSICASLPFLFLSISVSLSISLSLSLSFETGNTRLDILIPTDPCTLVVSFVKCEF